MRATEMERGGEVAKAQCLPAHTAHVSLINKI